MAEAATHGAGAPDVKAGCPGRGSVNSMFKSTQSGVCRLMHPDNVSMATKRAITVKKRPLVLTDPRKANSADEDSSHLRLGQTAMVAFSAPAPPIGR